MARLTIGVAAVLLAYASAQCNVTCTGCANTTFVVNASSAPACDAGLYATTTIPTCASNETISINCIAPITNGNLANITSTISTFGSIDALEAWLNGSAIAFAEITPACSFDCSKKFPGARFLLSPCYTCNSTRRQAVGDALVICPNSTGVTQCFQDAVCDGLLTAGAACGNVTCPVCPSNSTTLTPSFRHSSSSSKKGLLGLLGLLGLIPLLLCCCLLCCLFCIRRKKVSKEPVHFATFDACAGSVIPPFDACAGTGAPIVGTTAVYGGAPTFGGAPIALP